VQIQSLRVIQAGSVKREKSAAWWAAFEQAVMRYQGRTFTVRIRFSDGYYKLSDTVYYWPGWMLKLVKKAKGTKIAPAPAEPVPVRAAEEVSRVFGRG
jgi:hypothetical protein